MEQFKHIDITVTEEIKEYTNDIVLDNKEYLVVEKVKIKAPNICTIMKKNIEYQVAHCTKCHTEYEIDHEVIHNEKTLCKECGAVVTIKLKRYGRKGLKYSGLVYSFEKSKISNKHIVCKAYRIVRDGYENYQDVKTEYNFEAGYVFGPNFSKMYVRNYKGEIQKRASIFNVAKIMGYSSYGCFYGGYDEYVDWNSYERAIKGTIYEGANIEKVNEIAKYENMDIALKILSACSLNPMMESMAKIELIALLKGFVKKEINIKNLNWRKKSIPEILDLDKNELREFRKLKDKSAEALILFKKIRKRKCNLTIEEMDNLIREISCVMYKVDSILDIVNIGTWWRYINKQYKKYEDYETLKEVAVAFVDYIDELKVLKQDINNKTVIYPKNLKESHIKTTVQIKINNDPSINEKIKKRVKELENYKFEYKNLEIRAIKDMYEIIREGKELAHCVGRYAVDHAKKKTTILVVRRKENIEKPYYTVEVRKDEVIQCQGKAHCTPTEEVKEFMEIFKKEKLGNVKNKRVKVA
ncbi:PcfJ domain-containing protein [uncultured Clostridium sp.]|uniref:PcfJ domain-containing protein n=1 Tax=uncultured Clostridium sp. TaxID=59620 RepID=UPI00260B889B|nr:PcfJ domain-containing protein [uncultured Clostridium sp.]